MTDEQCEALIDVLKRLTNAIVDSSHDICESIECIYTASNEGIERRIDALIEVIDNASYRGTSCRYNDD